MLTHPTHPSQTIAMERSLLWSEYPTNIGHSLHKSEHNQPCASGWVMGIFPGLGDPTTNHNHRLVAVVVSWKWQQRQQQGMSSFFCQDDHPKVSTPRDIMLVVSAQGAALWSNSEGSILCYFVWQISPLSQPPLTPLLCPCCLHLLYHQNGILWRVYDTSGNGDDQSWGRRGRIMHRWASTTILGVSWWWLQPTAVHWRHGGDKCDWICDDDVPLVWFHGTKS